MSPHRVVFFFLVGVIVSLPAAGDTVTNLKTDKQYSGRILLREEKDGRERFVFESEQGKLGWLWANEWEVTGSGTPVKSVKPDEPQQPAPEQAAPDPHLTEVEVTGVGLAPDKAEQHAYNVAIERAVGVLVDAETLVENDRIIRDKVLTYSKGFVETFDIVRQWEEDGLHYVSARAAVRVGKIIGKLEASNVQLRPIAGHDERLRILRQIQAETNAAEMFTRIMKDCRLDKLCKVTIEGKPKTISKDSTHAKLRIEAKVAVNMAKYQAFARRLRPLLETVASKKSECTYKAQPTQDGWVGNGSLKSPGAEDLFNRLSGEGRVVGLLRDLNKSATLFRYHLYRVPSSFEGAILDTRQKKYRLSVAMVDSGQNVLMEIKYDLTTGYWAAPCFLPLSSTDTCATKYWQFSVTATWLGPFLYGGGEALFVVCEVDVDVPLEVLDKTSHYTVSIEQVKPE